jgi:two-component system sensor histidine kinase KdpD
VEPRRPDPDELLRHLEEEERRAARARLKVFLGAAPGVGKTYAMLQEAADRKRNGEDLLVGVVETHGRSETAALLEGLEILPRRSLVYRNVTLEEFDLDAALARRPAVILMDELAHTNVEGSRHSKRWQDVNELLDAGIDVLTTVNIQHIETHRDAVAKITGVTVREAVPDTVLERADEIELVDIPVEVLQERLRQGKVYVPEQARHAVDRFFRKGNLLALREMALRKTAERVDADMRRYMRSEGIQQTWPAGDKVLVAVGSGPGSTRTIRSAGRLAAVLGAPWIAAHVEHSRRLLHSEVEEEQVRENLRLAERLGAEVAVLQPSGLSVSADLLALARERNVTRIIVGKSSRPRWMERLGGSLVAELVQGGEDIDVHVIGGASKTAGVRPALPAPTPISALRLGLSALAVGVTALVSHLLRRHLDLADIAMIFVLCIAVVAARFGRWASLAASVLSVAALDFLFVPPYYTFAVADLKHMGTFAIMLGVGLAIGDMAERIRSQARMAQEREQHTGALFRFSTELAAEGDIAAVGRAVSSRVASRFKQRAVLLLPGPGGSLQDISGAALGPEETGVAQWVFEHGSPAGRGTDTLPGAKGLYLPLTGSEGAVGVLGILQEQEGPRLRPDQRHLLEAFAGQAALALERARLAEERASARGLADREKLRNALLSSVSHDLRTPLGAITGAASSLLDPDSGLGEEDRRDLLLTVHEEAQRLHRLVCNLLDITRLESGTLQVKKEWVPLEEIVGSALGRLEDTLKDRDIRLDLPEILAPVDAVLMEQVLVNLLENAAKYSPQGTPMDLAARVSGDSLTLDLADRGPGIPPGEEERIFEKLVRGSNPLSRPGAGLGLAICRGVVQAHGGTIHAENRPDGGARFRIRLPLPVAPEPPPVEEVERG